MQDWIRPAVQGVLGIGCMVLAYTVFLKPEVPEAVRASLFGAGFGMLGNAVPGPNQITKAEAARQVEAARANSTPPARA